MRDIIINAYAADPKNIGDLASSPLQYFDFGYPGETLDIRTLDPSFATPKSGFGGSITLSKLKKTASHNRYHLVVGGGGLLFEQFLGSFKSLEEMKAIFSGKWILWGTGQQIYSSINSSHANLKDYFESAHKKFDYSNYTNGFDLVGIRDFGFEYDWVPCASCMHPTFDLKRKIKHEFVVFSHKKYKISMPSFPSMSNDSHDFEKVIDFLGSGETILTSSYHGAYWGSLLGRKVVVFPFSTKFFTLKNYLGIYSVKRWKHSRIKFRPFKKTFLNKIGLEFKNGNHFTCDTQGWENISTDALGDSSILQDCRVANIKFFKRVMYLLNK